MNTPVNLRDKSLKINRFWVALSVLFQPMLMKVCNSFNMAQETHLATHNVPYFRKPISDQEEHPSSWITSTPPFLHYRYPCTLKTSHHSMYGRHFWRLGLLQWGASWESSQHRAPPCKRSKEILCMALECEFRSIEPGINQVQTWDLREKGQRRWSKVMGLPTARCLPSTR